MEVQRKKSKPNNNQKQSQHGKNVYIFSVSFHFLDGVLDFLWENSFENWRLIYPTSRMEFVVFKGNIEITLFLNNFILYLL